MTITFQFLRDIQKKERNTITLQEVPTDFYSEIANYMSKKKKNVVEYNNIVPVVKFILERREQKIINSALRYSRTDGGKKPKNLLKEEEKMFDVLVQTIRAYRIDLNTISNNYVKYNDSKYKVNEDVPEFVAVDMNTYGPWKKGDVIEISEDVAEPLLDSGKIKKVSL